MFSCTILVAIISGVLKGQIISTQWQRLGSRNQIICVLKGQIISAQMAPPWVI
jgi:hypothetical protein